MLKDPVTKSVAFAGVQGRGEVSVLEKQCTLGKDETLHLYLGKVLPAGGNVASALRTM
ncbi:hypothetical protein ZHAS_00018538 [Anopheles sinensis]|uniref:Uncharacterized protein n=1 Tax=Anopheles sinensis TaxID=74873 RepID=A0A084WJV6_ANOSI|nr:hypothetical protein ZHAS_00018538 [Anopheles sinensis]